MINTNTFRTTVAAALGGAVLLAGLIAGASIALAADDDQDAVVEDGAVVESGERVRSHVRDMCGHIGDIADELGLDFADLRERLRDGATLEELANEAGIDLDAVIETLRDRVINEIEERVADGSLSEERADDLRERIESFDLGELPDFGEFEFRFDGFDRDMRFGDHDWFGDLDLDIDLSELRERLESGMMLDDALADLGVDLDDALEEARAAAIERIDELVTDGVLSEERAAELKDMIENFGLDGEVPFGGGFRFDFDGFGDRGYRGGFHHHGGGFGDLDGGATDESTNGEGVLLEI